MYGRVAEFQCHCYLHRGVEFVVPYGGDLSKSLNRSGTRLHHLAYKTMNLIETITQVKALGLELLLPEPTQGIGGMIVNFIIPNQRGVLIELVQV